MKCVKGKDWVEENEYHKNKSDRKCVNCIYQFSCDKSDFQPK